jgi:hypothetical protein
MFVVISYVPPSHIKCTCTNTLHHTAKVASVEVGRVEQQCVIKFLVKTGKKSSFIHHRTVWGQ